MIEPLTRILLASVFLVAALTKLADVGGSRRSLAAFGVPPTLSGPLGVLLPLAELAVGIALVPVASAVAGAIGAMLLLALFIAGIGLNLLRGRRPDCHCFGQLYSKPVGWPTLARNLALLAAAAFVAIGGATGAPVSVLAWAGPLPPVQQAAVVTGSIVLVLLGLQSLLLLKLVRQQDRILTRLETPGPTSAVVAVPAPTLSAPAQPAGRPVGTTAPEFVLPSMDGRDVSLAGLRAERKPIVLFFSDPNCSPCARLMPEFAELEQKHAHVLTVAVVSRGTPEANREKAPGLARVALQRDREIFEAYGVAGTPSVVVVNPDGTIASALAQGDAEIRQLLAPLVMPNVAGASAPPSPAPTPAPPTPLPKLSAAPEFNLTDLGGRSFTLATFASRERLVLFWNPTCGYCQRMLPDLKTWEEAAVDGPQLMVISTGTVEANQALGLRAPIALDPDGFAIAHRFGVQGTPSAALIDAQGRLADGIAAGAPAIFELLGSAPAPAQAAAEEPVPELPEDVRPKKERCVHDELLPDGSMVLYNACRNQVMTLNQTAALVWEYCDGEHGMEAIAAELGEVFPHAADTVQDVRAVLRNLSKAGMIFHDVVPEGATDERPSQPSDVRS